MLGYHGLNHNILLLLYTAYGVYFVIVRSRNPWNLAKWILVGMMDCRSSHGWNDQFNHKKNWFPTCNGYLINPTKQTPLYIQSVCQSWVKLIVKELIMLVDNVTSKMQYVCQQYTTEKSNQEWVSMLRNDISQRTSDFYPSCACRGKIEEQQLKQSTLYIQPFHTLSLQLPLLKLSSDFN